MSQNQIPESSWPGPDDEGAPGYDGPYNEQAQAISRWTPKKKRNFVAAAVAVLFLITLVTGTLNLLWQNKSDNFVGLETQQPRTGLSLTSSPSGVEEPGSLPQRQPQQHADEVTLDKSLSATASPRMGTPDYQPGQAAIQGASTTIPTTPITMASTLNQQLEAISNQIAQIEDKLNGLNFPANNDKSAPDMVKALQAMTEDMQKLAKENEVLKKSNSDIQLALRATERQVDKLTQENARLVKTQPKKNESKVTEASKTIGEPVARWTVMGLAANRVVIQDGNGNIHALEAGKSLDGVKILSVDLAKGDVKTSAGVISYLKK